MKTVNLCKILNKNFDDKEKTFNELRDYEKQSLAEHFITDNIFTNAWSLVEELNKNEKSEYQDELDHISGSYDYFNTINDYLMDQDTDELLAILNDYFDFDFEELQKLIDKKDHLNDLLCADSNTEISKTKLENKKIENDFALIESKDEIIRLMLADLEQNNSFIDFCDYEQIDPIFDPTLEYFVVSDFFARRIENCENIFGLNIWGRSCYGQSVSLDHDIQVATFNIYSE